MSIPKVSIIVPVYNVEKYIHRCMNSILAQTFTDFECILVDDCSPDNCPKICDEYAERMGGIIKVIHKIKNEGLPQARKTGFENSSGDYIQFVDSDDWIEPDMIEKLYAAAVETSADIVTCDYFRNNAHDYYYEMQTIDTKNNFNNLGFIHWCAVWNKFFHRKIITRINFPNAYKYEDRVITQQAIFYAKKIVKIPLPLYHYCTNEGPTFLGNNYKKYYGWRENILLVIDFLRENLKDEFALKESEINNYVNIFKLKALRNKIVIKDKSFITFYPKSKFFRWLFFRLLHKAIILIIPHGVFIFLEKSKNKKLSNIHYG